MQLIMNMPVRTVDEWVIAIKGTIIYVHESRALNFCFNLYKFILTLGLLWTSSANLMYWMISAVVILLPYCLLSALNGVAILGDTLYITDEDLEHALGCIGLGCIFRWILSYTKSTKRSQYDQVSHVDVEHDNHIELQKTTTDSISQDNNVTIENENESEVEQNVDSAVASSSNITL